MYPSPYPFLQGGGPQRISNPRLRIENYLNTVKVIPLQYMTHSHAGHAGQGVTACCWGDLLSRAVSRNRIR